MLGDATTDHFAGVVTNSATWTDPAAGCPGNVLYNVAAVAQVNVAGTPTNSAEITSGAFHASFSTCDAIRQLWFVDISRVSTTYTFNVWWIVQNPSTHDIPISQFLGEMALITPTNPTGLYQFGTNRALTVDEGANGALNTVNCYWNRADLAMNICALAVSVLA